MKIEKILTGTDLLKDRLYFDENEHKYFMIENGNEIEIENVSSIINKLNLKKDYIDSLKTDNPHEQKQIEGYKNKAALNGRIIHHIGEQFFVNHEIPETISEDQKRQLETLLQSYNDFGYRRGYQIWQIEINVLGQFKDIHGYHYAGTIDTVLIKEIGDEITICFVDLKKMNARLYEIQNQLNKKHIMHSEKIIAITAQLYLYFNIGKQTNKAFLDEMIKQGKKIKYEMYGGLLLFKEKGTNNNPSTYIAKPEAIPMNDMDMLNVIKKYTQELKESRE